jgi:hypothetical protein
MFLPRMRCCRTITSVCVYEKTCPMWSEPLTVGGGVSTTKVSSRPRVLS